MALEFPFLGLIYSLGSKVPPFSLNISKKKTELDKPTNSPAADTIKKPTLSSEHSISVIVEKTQGHN